MTLLTPGEYDDLPQNLKDQLAGIVRQPHQDTKSNEYRKFRGRYMNGELDADPVVQQRVGYGTGSSLAPGDPNA